MIRQPITVGGEHFSTKGALLERIRGILYGTPEGSDVSPAHAAFLTAALQRANVYYSFPAEQPVRWQVRRQLIIGNHPEFVFTRPDGSEENPSIKRLSTQKPLGGKRPVDGARQAVVDHVLDFRSSARPRCARCNAVGLELEVHHDEPTFARIWQMFLAQPGIVEAEMSVIEYRTDAGVMHSFCLAPPHDRLFRAFHREHARLQLLCLICHDHITHNRNDRHGME